MSDVIWKYELDPTTKNQAINMPGGAEILTVQIQRGKPVVWARVKPENRLFVDRVFCTAWTGQAFGSNALDGLNYVGTYQIKGLVHHVYA